MNEYDTCKLRGHEQHPGMSGVGDGDDKGAWYECRWCGAWFRWATVLEERLEASRVIGYPSETIRGDS